MFEELPFHELIGMVRSGNQEAARELWLRYEEPIRRTIRARLRGARLQRLLDSTDISQSVLGNFFKNVAEGRYELDTPEQLIQLLTSMAHHKLTNEVHKHRALRRDHRRIAASPLEEQLIPSPESSPSELVSRQELLRNALRRLSPQVRRILELRVVEGREWAEIAKTVGDKPEALRKKYLRALIRVRKLFRGSR
jgi:RNA polymerase sigma-70 factor (ECF subfamily)